MTGIGNATPTKKRGASETLDSPKPPPAIRSKRTLYNTGIIRVGRTDAGDVSITRSTSLADMVRDVPDNTGQSSVNITEGTHRKTLKAKRSLQGAFQESRNLSLAIPENNDLGDITQSPRAGRVFGRGFTAGSSASVGDVAMLPEISKTKESSTDLSIASGQTTQSPQTLHRNDAFSSLNALVEALPFGSPIQSPNKTEPNSPTGSVGSSPIAQPKQKPSPWG